MLVLTSIAPLLGAYGNGGGWGWGWVWWWWWIAIIFLFWLFLLPPFAYGRRWYSGYRTRYGGAASVTPADDDRVEAQWQAIESRFVDAPATAVVEADRFVTERLSRLGTSPMNVPGYRDAHAVALRAQRGEVTTDELHAAMVTFRNLLNGPAPA